MTQVREQEIAINVQVGNAAGEVWRLLDQGGVHSLTQMKKKFSGTGELLGFAVGWLAREDKLEIFKKKRAVVLRLK
jgi:hypothetical protein